MDRRRFLGNLVGGLALAAAERTFQFRVFSFPTEIVKPKWTEMTIQFGPAPVPGLSDAKIWTWVGPPPVPVEIMEYVKKLGARMDVLSGANRLTEYTHKESGSRITLTDAT